MAWLQQTPGSGGRASPTVFEQQREELVREIAVGMEQVLQNINRLNRNLESVIAVGNEFGSVEALWSQFENFMGRTEDQGEEAGNDNGKRKVSGESDASKSGVKRENDEGDSTVMQ
ncbi:DASH complex subunit Dad1 [Penicillium cf. griseofulvum]|uniref:DASH complex subunit DAD1 n=1 Tax=Penicillium cf. griseofulvum TaxID=2972120 RepID=A0A9W9MG19_9EURO|nr:DASH complex subunit Dad1 [Penicillium cf. griseofulvum]KAJ5423620.1 DASH complex subunit Dad1 [Penicillium cf. griseofulvum]KAJ5431127.1 DASH complex subunit Dad1 [Penicillium cf. griseofulvum]